MSTDIVWHEHHTDKAVRAAQKNQTPRVLWLTGLSGSGKSTIANLLEQKLVAQHKHTYLLDGDNIRHGLCGDLGFVIKIGLKIFVASRKSLSYLWIAARSLLLHLSRHLRLIVTIAARF